MSTKSKHADNARGCLDQAVRFYVASGHGGKDGRGSVWSTGVALDTRIMHVSTARMFAEMAVQEAAHARPEGHDGPTDLQVEASKLADNCTRLSQQLAHDIARGALRTGT